MKKSLVILISLSLIVLLSVSFVSASWFGDIWKKITGKTTENDTSGTGCADECSIGNKRCSGNYNYQICGNYDSDSCTEWLSADSPASSCPSSEICVQGDCVSNTYICDDSDGGKDYNVKGRVTASSPTSSTDVTDLCSDSTKVVEYFCTNLQQSGETYTCPNGCSNGACVSSSATTTTTANQTTNTATTSNQTTSVSCADSDGGKNYNVQGRTTATSGDITDITEVCSGKYVIEHSCASTGLIASEYYLCANGCSNGACVSGTTTLNQTTSTTTTSIVAAPTTSTTTTTSVSAGASSGGKTTSTKLEISEGVFEENTIEEKTEGEIKIKTEAKKFTDRIGNKVEVKVKTEIREDGTTLIEEEREFFTKSGILIKLKSIIENDGANIKIKREIEIGGEKIESGMEMMEKFEGEEVKLKAKLSNGNEQEIKIMPDRASEIAIEQLKSKNFNVELKEVGEENNLKAVYIAKVDENGRLLGLFKVRLKSEAQINSETGEILDLKKQWWNFLAIKLKEPLTLLGNQTNITNITLPPPVNITINNTNNLTNITLPAPINQTNISFGNQTNLTNITLPSSINWSINYSCTDSDGGKNYSIKGNVVAKSPTADINVTDLCSDSIKVVEYFCINSSQSGETHNCPNGCSNGACL